MEEAFRLFAAAIPSAAKLVRFVRLSKAWVKGWSGVQMHVASFGNVVTSRDFGSSCVLHDVMWLMCYTFVSWRRAIIFDRWRSMSLWAAFRGGVCTVAVCGDRKIGKSQCGIERWEAPGVTRSWHSWLSSCLRKLCLQPVHVVQPVTRDEPGFPASLNFCRGWIRDSALNYSCDSYPSPGNHDAPGNEEKDTMEEVFRNLGLGRPPGRRKLLTSRISIGLKRFWSNL